MQPPQRVLRLRGGHKSAVAARDGCYLIGKTNQTSALLAHLNYPATALASTLFALDDAGHTPHTRRSPLAFFTLRCVLQIMSGSPYTPPEHYRIMAGFISWSRTPRAVWFALLCTSVPASLVVDLTLCCVPTSGRCEIKPRMYECVQ